MDFKDKLEDLDSFGIDLKIKDYDCQTFYLETLRQWMENEHGYETYIIEELEFIVEKEAFSLLTIYVQDGILRFKNGGDGAYEVLMDVLEFIAKHHSQTTKIFDYLNESGNSVEDWFSGEPLKNVATIEEDSEEESEEISEWL